MKKTALATFMILGLLTFASPQVYALSGEEAVCESPGDIPVDCRQNFAPDHACNIAKIADPSVDCCMNYCPEFPSTKYNASEDCAAGNTGSCDAEKVFNSLNIFGTKVQYSPAKIPSLIQLAISAVLAVVSFYALFRGMFLYAIKRPNTIDAGEIGKINKEFGNIIIGFVLAWSVIFLVEFVMRILGLPSLSQIDIATIDEGDGANVIVIQ